MKLANPAKAIRWKYVAPRAAIVLAVAAVLRFGLDGALRWALITSGQTALGAKVEIGDLSTRLLDGQIVIADVAAANPGKPMRNLFDAKEVRLEVDAAQLTHRRLIVRDGLISGLRFDSIRAASGALQKDGASGTDDGPSALDPLVDAAEQRTELWLDDVAGRLEGDLTAELKTPALANDLETRWPRQYEDFKQRVEAVRAQAKQIELRFREVRENPLRNLGKLQDLQQQVVATEHELKKLHADVEQLPKQAEADRAALDAARQHDQQYLRERLDAGSLDGDQLSRYLLGDVAGRRVATAMRWITMARRMAPVKKLSVERESRRRGVDVLFVDRPQPKWLIESVGVDGAAAIGGEPLQLKGMLTNLSSHPQLLAEPARLQLTGAGGFDCRVLIEMDRRAAEARDQIALDCLALPLPAQSLGKPERMNLSIAASEATLTARLTIVDEEISGTIELTQPSVAVTAAVPMISDPQLGAALTDAFAAVDRFAALVEISGTLDRPQWRLQSDLGGQLADGFNAAVKAYLQQRADRVMAQVQARVDEQVAKLDAKRLAMQQELMAKLGENQQLISELAALAGGGIRPDATSLGIPQLGEALKAGILKR